MIKIERYFGTDNRSHDDAFVASHFVHLQPAIALLLLPEKNVIVKNCVTISPC
jgi:hypothetical protein